MDYVIADTSRMELGYLENTETLDIDVGDTNDFELTIPRERSEYFGIQKGYCIFVPNTEFGGMIEEIQSATSETNITYRGNVWRLYLDQLIIEPPSGQAYQTVSGDANSIIAQILSQGTGLLFDVPDENSGIYILSYRFRYVSALSGLSAMLEAQGGRLDIKAMQGDSNEPFRVVVRAVKIQNYSEELEYNGDDNINVNVQKYERGINHLICLGQGELTDRLVIHLYAQLDGSISQTRKYYTGTAERTAVYDFSNAEQDELLDSGIERLKELMNSSSADMDIEDANLEIGDIVTARDRDAGIVLSRPIVNKILRFSDGRESVEHKVKGEN